MPVGHDAVEPGATRAARALRRTTYAPSSTGTATTRPTTVAPVGDHPDGSCDRCTDARREVTAGDDRARRAGHGRRRRRRPPGRGRRPAGGARRGRRRRRRRSPRATTAAAPQSASARGERRGMTGPSRDRPARPEPRDGIRGKEVRGGAARRLRRLGAGRRRLGLLLRARRRRAVGLLRVRLRAALRPAVGRRLRAVGLRPVDFEPTVGRRLRLARARRSRAWRRCGCRSCRSPSPSARCPTGWKTLATLPPHSACFFSGSSENDWQSSNSSPHLAHS